MFFPALSHLHQSITYCILIQYLVSSFLVKLTPVAERQNDLDVLLKSVKVRGTPS